MTNKTDAEILADGPEGATHVDEDGYYIKQVDYEDGFADSKTYFHCGTLWVFLENPSLYLLRSLADIAELVELRKKNAELEKMILYK